MIFAPVLTLENAATFSKTDLAHMVLAYQKHVARLTAELEALKQVGT